MKNKILKSLVTVLAIFFVTYAQAQNPKVYVVTFVADWCPVCKAQNPRMDKEVKSSYANSKNVVFLERNMTSPSTTAESDKQLDKFGLLAPLKSAMYTGLSYIVNASSKELVGEISTSEQTYKIINLIDNSVNGTKSFEAVKDPKIYYLALQYLKPKGEQKLDDFNKLASPILAKYGFKAEGAMKPFHVLPGIGDNSMQTPSQIIIFSAPNDQALLKMVMDVEYQKILPIRNEALSELTFIATKKLF